MVKKIALLVSLCLGLSMVVSSMAPAAGETPPAPVLPNDLTLTEGKVIRALVIGGMTMTGLWQEIVARFEKETGYKVVLVDTGPRPGLDKAFREGKADLLTMHSGDITTDLVVDGYGTNMRPWARNDLVVLGPPGDPARIRGLKSGAEAFRRIAKTQSPFLDALDAGGREMAYKIWKRAGLKPRGPWVIRDDSKSNDGIPAFASEKGAYLVFGRMPFLFEKVGFGKLELMVEGDPDMRRPYIVMEANPARFPTANWKGARMLSDFLLSEKTQKFMKEFRAKEFGGLPLFYPVWPVGT